MVGLVTNGGGKDAISGFVAEAGLLFVLMQNVNAFLRAGLVLGSFLADYTVQLFYCAFTLVSRGGDGTGRFLL